jgi:hypothetical protein
MHEGTRRIGRNTQRRAYGFIRGALTRMESTPLDQLLRR